MSLLDPQYKWNHKIWSFVSEFFYSAQSVNASSMFPILLLYVPRCYSPDGPRFCSRVDGYWLVPIFQLTLLRPFTNKSV